MYCLLLRVEQRCCRVAQVLRQVFLDGRKQFSHKAFLKPKTLNSQCLFNENNLLQNPLSLSSLLFFFSPHIGNFSK